MAVNSYDRDTTPDCWVSQGDSCRSELLFFLRSFIIDPRINKEEFDMTQFRRRIKWGRSGFGGTPKSSIKPLPQYHITSTKLRKNKSTGTGTGTGTGIVIVLFVIVSSIFTFAVYAGFLCIAIGLIYSSVSSKLNVTDEKKATLNLLRSKLSQFWIEKE